MLGSTTVDYPSARRGGQGTLRRGNEDAPALVRCGSRSDCGRSLGLVLVVVVVALLLAEFGLLVSLLVAVGTLDVGVVVLLCLLSLLLTFLGTVLRKQGSVGINRSTGSIGGVALYLS